MKSNAMKTLVKARKLGFMIYGENGGIAECRTEDCVDACPLVSHRTVVASVTNRFELVGKRALPCSQKTICQLRIPLFIEDT